MSRRFLLDVATFLGGGALAAGILTVGAAAWAYRKGLLPAIDLGDLLKGGQR